MIEEQAQVKEIQGANAILEVVRQQHSCNACNLNAGCGVASLGRLLGFRQKPFSLPNHMNLKKGDKVIIGMAENSYVMAGFIIYLLPLACLFTFSLIADMLFGSIDGLNVLAAITGLITGFLLAARLSRQTYSKSMQPHVVRQIW